MHLEAAIEHVGRYTWRPWSIKIGKVFEGGWSAGNWFEGGQYEGSRSASCESGGGSLEAICHGSWDTIHWLTRDCGNVENWIQQRPLRDWLGAGDSWHSDNAVCGVCSTQWMLYSVYAVLSVCCPCCYLLIMAWKGVVGWLNFMFLGDGRVEDEMEQNECHGAGRYGDTWE